ARARGGAPSALLRARSWTCGAGLGRRVPVLLAGGPDIEGGGELSQAGNEGNLLERFSKGEARVVGFWGGGWLGGSGQGGHIEDVAQLAAAAGDVADTDLLAAVVGVGSDAEESGDLEIADLAELWEPGEEGGDALGAEAGDTVEQAGAFGQKLVLGDEGCDSGLELGDGAIDVLEHVVSQVLTEGGTLVLAPVQALDSHLDQILTLTDEGGELLAVAIGRAAGLEVEGLGEPGDGVGVDGVVLGPPPGRPGEVAHPLGV